jgi:hypothetical protein
MTKLKMSNIFSQILARNESLTHFLLLSLGEPVSFEALDEDFAYWRTEKW